MEPFVSLLFSSPTIAIGAVFLLFAFYLVSVGSVSGDRRKEPPGPRALPLLGNLLQLDLSRPYRTLCEFSKTYGSVFTVYFGPRKVVVLAGYKAVKEALISYAEEFGERDVSPIFNDINRGHGILFSNGDSWKEMRRFALSTLRDFGMGRRLVEGKILEECGHLIQMFENQKGKPFDMAHQLNCAVSNIISSIVYGSRFEYNDPRFRNMVSRTNESIRVAGSAQIQIYNMFPWLARWIKNKNILLKLTELKIKDIKDLINQLKETLNPQTCRGLVDCFLIRKQKDEDSGVKDTHFHEENLIYTVSNLFSAGTDTTATTLRWSLLLMAKYPHYQVFLLSREVGYSIGYSPMDLKLEQLEQFAHEEWAKIPAQRCRSLIDSYRSHLIAVIASKDQVQEELARVIGSRKVWVEDCKNLPFTNAVIHETQRLASIVPMSIPHKTSQDVTFQGYFIKKDTIVFPLLTSVLHDESEWESPHTFNPSHFLDKEGKFIRRDAFLPFSAGRRVCLGEGLAKMELFLFFTSLLQHFYFTPPPGVSENELDLMPAVGFTVPPLPHKLCAVSRQ